MGGRRDGDDGYYRASKRKVRAGPCQSLHQTARSKRGAAGPSKNKETQSERAGISNGRVVESPTRNISGTVRRLGKHGIERKNPGRKRATASGENSNGKKRGRIRWSFTGAFGGRWPLGEKKSKGGWESIKIAEKLTIGF